MRYRIDNYTAHTYGSYVYIVFDVDLSHVTLDGQGYLDEASVRRIKESLRLVVDETANVVLCSSMQKSLILNVVGSDNQDFKTVSISIKFAIPSGKTITGNDMFTIEMDWGDAPGASPSADQLAQFFGLPQALPEYTALTPAEAIAIARDCQYNVMGTDWPIPTWLPTGVTEAQVESAAEGLGIPYHEPTQTA